MKKLFILLIVVLGAMLTQTSCTTQQLGLANQSMQIVERYESQARIWKANNPHKRNSLGARVIKYGNITSYMEWDNAFIKNERGFVLVYMKNEEGDFILVKKLHPYKADSYSFFGVTRYGSESVRVVSSSSRIDVYTSRESYQMH